MSDEVIPQRELRNDISGVLRRVQAGERLAVSVRGRVVAQLTPASAPGTATSRERFIAVVAGTLDADQADRLREDLAAATGDLVDDL